MASELVPVVQAEEVTLAACPIGLFMCAGELCLKTEYGSNEGRIDAYIVSSGEFFWGHAPQSIASQRATMVRPVEMHTPDDTPPSAVGDASGERFSPAHYDGNTSPGWYHTEMDRRAVDVTHWRPLPEPPSLGTSSLLGER